MKVVLRVGIKTERRGYQNGATVGIKMRLYIYNIYIIYI